MTLISCTETETNRRKLEIEVDAETFKNACERAYRKNVGKFNIPGFRRGKAPRKVIEKAYGKEFFYEEAINDVYKDALLEAIDEAGLEYVDDKMDLNVENVSEEGFTFTAVITVKPEIKLGDYKAIKASCPSSKVSDEQLDEEMKKIQEKNARSVDVDDRAAKLGDTVIFDFEGFVDGVPFDGGKAENYSLELGSGDFIPGFEDQMVGHSCDEEFDVNVTFPEEYHSEELSGKPAVFKIKLHTIREKELLDLDDDFAKDFSEFDTIEEYKADVRKELESAAEKKAKTEVDNQVTNALVDLVEGEIPEAMYENSIDQNVSELSYSLQAQGIAFKDYLNYIGQTMEDVRAGMRERAEKQVKLRLALEYIVKAENLTLEDGKIDEEFAKLAKRYNTDVETIKKAITEKDFATDLLVEKALDFVRENVEITEAQ